MEDACFEELEESESDASECSSWINFGSSPKRSLSSVNTPIRDEVLTRPSEAMEGFSFSGNLVFVDRSEGSEAEREGA
jgi:hypothetical protein